MTVEMDPTPREIILEPAYMIRIVMEAADRQKILDETGNPIRDEYGNFILDDAL